MPVEGMIVVDPLIDDPILTRLATSGLPVVTCEVDPSGGQHAGSVAGDNAAGVRRMLDHLTAQGAVTIAVIAPPETTSWSIESLAAYRDFCSERGIPERLATVGFVSTPESERAAVEQILAGGQVDAILSLPDGGAAAALQVAGDARAAGAAGHPDRIRGGQRRDGPVDAADHGAGAQSPRDGRPGNLNVGPAAVRAERGGERTRAR